MTHKELLLKYFNEVKNDISVQESNQELMINDPRGTIRDLRNDGYKILDHKVYVKNRFGKPCSYKKYFLIKDDVDYQNFSRSKEISEKNRETQELLEKHTIPGFEGTLEMLDKLTIRTK